MKRLRVVLLVSFLIVIVVSFALASNKNKTKAIDLGCGITTCIRSCDSTTGGYICSTYAVGKHYTADGNPLPLRVTAHAGCTLCTFYGCLQSCSRTVIKDGYGTVSVSASCGISTAFEGNCFTWNSYCSCSD